jgi:hypothetical protein
MLGINGSTSIGFPSDEVVTLPILNMFFGDVKGNPVPTNNTRIVTGTFTSYPFNFLYIIILKNAKCGRIYAFEIR